MTSRHTLHLYEKILLLELDEDKGTQIGGMPRVGLGGAILAELVMLGAVSIDDDKHKRVHRVTGQKRLADAVLREALAKVKEAKKPKKAAEWVQKFAGMKDLKNRTARQLVKKGILKEDTGTVLKIFKRTIFPETNPGPEQELRRQMHEAIFTDTKDVDPGTIVIVSLANATGLLKKIFDKKELKARKERLENLSSGQVVGKATKEVVQAIQTAVMVCTIMPAITAATTTH